MVLVEHESSGFTQKTFESCGSWSANCHRSKINVQIHALFTWGFNNNIINIKVDLLHCTSLHLNSEPCRIKAFSFAVFWSHSMLYYEPFSMTWITENFLKH